jgi:hypothetical protein
MQYGTIMMLVSLCAASLLASPAKDQATRQLAIHTAARRTLDAAEAIREPGLERQALIASELTTAIADARIHAQRSKSRERLKDDVRALLTAAFHDQRAAILAVAQEQSPLPLSEADILAVLRGRHEPVLDVSIHAYLESNYPGLFEQVRDDAVARARQTLDRQVMQPAFEALDPAILKVAGDPPRWPAQWDAQQTAALRKTVAELTRTSDQPQLEEVDRYVRELSQRVAEAIRAQIEAQRDLADSLLADVDVTTARLASEFGRDVLAAFESRWSRREPEVTEVTRYPLFTLVEQHVGRESDRIEISRMAAFLVDTPFLAVTADAVRPVMAAAPQEHLIFADSRKRLLAKLQQERRPALGLAYADGSDIPDEVSAALTRRLQQIGDPVQIAFLKRLEAELDPILLAERKRLSDAQISGHFAWLEALERLPDEVLIHVLDRGDAPLSSLAEALAFWGGVESMPAAPLPPLLEETADWVRLRTANLITAAASTLREQLALLRAIENERQTSLIEDVGAGKPYAQIHAEWLDVYTRRWGEQPLADGPYAALTGPARVALDRAVRQHYEATEQSLAEARQQQDSESVEASAAAADAAGLEATEDPPVPEETVAPEPDEAEAEPEAETIEGGAGAGPPSGGEEGLAERVMPDVLLILREQEQGGGEAVMITAAGQLRWTFDARDVHGAVEAIYDGMQPGLMALVDMARGRSTERSWFGLRKRRETPQVSFHLVVESGAVRHRSSLLLHRRIEEHFAQDHAAPISLDWQASLDW